MDSNDKQNVYVRNIPSDLWRKVKIAALEREQTIQEAVIDGLKAYVQQQDWRKNNPDKPRSAGD